MASEQSTLSERGTKLASGPSMRDKAAQILAKQWHPIDNPDAFVNIGTAENHLMLDDIATFIKSKDLDLQGPDFDYGEGPWGSLRLRKGLANFINELRRTSVPPSFPKLLLIASRYFNSHEPIDPEDLTCANGCSSLFAMLSFILGDPGDGILLTMPNYIAFASDFELVGSMKPVFIPFNSTDQFSPDSISHYEEALREAEKSGIRARALMLCNPHNPLGRCYPPSTLIAILKLCSSHKLHLIADEIYAQSVYSTGDPDVVPFTSVLSLDYTKYIDKRYMHVVYGMSKDFACGGLRIGCIYSQNAELTGALSAINPYHWPGQIDQKIAVTILEDPSFIQRFLYSSRSRLTSASKLVRELLDEAGIPYAPGANAGFFLWVDLSRWLGKFKAEDGDKNGHEDGWAAEGKLMRRLLQHKVFLTPGKGQASVEAGWFRLVFSQQEEVLREGVRRLVNCLQE